MGFYYVMLGFPGGASGKESTCQCRKCNVTGLRSLGWEDPMEEGMATSSSIFARRMPLTEEPSGLQLILLQKSDTTEST